ncbi:alpha-amylase family protein [Angustibacter speluncae]
MDLTRTGDLWWKTAVVYCLDVETFYDSDGDGVGDLAGLAQRIDHLADLGVTCLWLMPFYPTAEKDDGYDITDFYAVDPRLGTLGDLVEVLRTAHDRGMRVIADLVVNHTSDQHPWFRSAKRSKASRYRDYYVWRADAPPDTSDEVVFPGEQEAIWTLDERTGEYYLHRFYAHQPDLDVTNPAVRDEIAKIVGFWLALGLDGFRVDAVPFLIESKGAAPAGAKDLGDGHQLLKDLRAFLNRRNGEAILLGEVNVPYKDQLKFFGGPDGDELTMQFDFVGMQQTYLSFARKDARPLARTLKRRPALRDTQWASFLRNHDELTLDKLTDAERQEVFDAFGPDPEMQVYGRGLVRRLPTMLEGDPRRIKMAYSLMFSLPGTPVLFYGEEIGMGENLAAGGRQAVRTPMQWSGDQRNGGFSDAAPSRLPNPVVEGAYGPQFVNVADQRRDDDSLLAFLSLLVRRYRECPELGWADVEVLDQPHRPVLAHLARWDDGVMVGLHNLGEEGLAVPLELPSDLRRGGSWDGHELVDLLQDARTPLDGRGRAEVTLDAYGHRWLRLTRPGDRRLL